MAQFPSAPVFGAGYPPFPMYPPFPSNPPQQLSNNPPGPQQSNAPGPSPHTPSAISNTSRYEVNTHINQAAPFPFPPNFNPELLKHFPPPPPPTNYTPAPGTPTGFSPFSQNMNNGSYPYVQQAFQHFPHVHTPMGGLFSHTENTLSGTALPGTTFGQQQNSAANNHIRNHEYSVDRNLDTTPAQDRLAPVLPVKHVNQINVADTQSIEDKTHSPKEYYPQFENTPNPTVAPASPTAYSVSQAHPRQSASPLLPQRRETGPLNGAQLKEHAKVAILSLNSYNIGFKDILAEGISSQVLQALFSDLGLAPGAVTADIPKPSPSNLENDTKPEDALTSTPSQLQITPVVSKTVAGPAANTSAKLSQVTSALNRPLAAISPGLERKDRIAQLLAAKTGKAAVSGLSPKSGSPVSSVDATATTSVGSALQGSRPPASSGENSSTGPSTMMAQTELVRQKVDKLRGETADRQKVQDVDVDNSLQGPSISSGIDRFGTRAAASVPPPVTASEQPLKQSVITSMIPGLFMGNDEEPEETLPLAALMQRASDQSIPLEQDMSAFHDVRSVSRGSLKRHANDDLNQDYLPDAKRPALSKSASEDAKTSVDQLEDDDASEGEIVEDEPELVVAQQHPVKISSINQSVSDITPNNLRQNQVASMDISMEDAKNYTQPEVRSQAAYSSKQIEIEAMRKKIAAMEQRKGNKRAQSFISSPATSNPTTPTNNQTPQASFGATAQSTQEVEPILIKEPIPPASRSITKLSPAELAEKAARLKADFIRQRALRQRQLTEGMPALNNEVEKTQESIRQSKSKLVEIRLVIQSHNRELLRAQQEEEQIVNEIARLEKQLQDGVSGQKQFSSELKQITQQEADEISKQQAITRQADQQGSTNNNRATAMEHIQGLSQTPEVQHQQHIDTAFAVQQNADTTEIKEVPVHGLSVTQNNLNSTNRQDEEIVPAESSTGLSSIDAGIDSDDDESMDQSDEESDDSQMNLDEASDGSASMSDSGSDGYEPAEPETAEDQINDFTVNEARDRFKSTDNQSSSNDSSENYEPSDHLESGQVTERQGLHHLYDPTLQSTMPDQQLSTVSKQHEPDPTTTVSTVAASSTTDDQENGLQLSEANTLTKTQDTLADNHIVLGDANPSSARFVPYQSPLSSFKSYRFHPSFADQVKTGYRSLTYSNKIDPKNPICPTELAGESCGDVDCHEQHFGSMALSDDKILVQMSSANDIKDKALRDQYLLGLKQVIARLRQEGVKEFSLVADALSKYRREWAAGQLGA